VTPTACLKMMEVIGASPAARRAPRASAPRQRSLSAGRLARSSPRVKLPSEGWPACSACKGGSLPALPRPVSKKRTFARLGDAQDNQGGTDARWFSPQCRTGLRRRRRGRPQPSSGHRPGRKGAAFAGGYGSSSKSLRIV
jgi:hypothetical protein